MEIGGHDLILMIASDVDVRHVAVERALAFWPNCIVVDDADGSILAGRSFTPRTPAERDEFLIFKDSPAHESWENDGPTDANPADMLHVIARPCPSDISLGEVTLVYHSYTESIRELVEDVRTGLTSAPNRKPTARSRG